jgi:hypothetical protein
MKTRTVKYHPEKKNFELILNAPDGSGMSEVYALWQDDEDYAIVSNLDSNAIYGRSYKKVEMRYKDETAVLSFLEDVQKSFDAGKIPLDRYIPDVTEPFGPKLMCEAYNLALNTFGYFMLTEKTDFLAYHLVRIYSKGDLSGGASDRIGYQTLEALEKHLLTEEMMDAYLDIYHKDLEISYFQKRRCYFLCELLPVGPPEDGEYCYYEYSKPLMIIFARPKRPMHKRQTWYI